MNKNVLVTGISSGIGTAICKKLLNEGYIVYGTYNTNVDNAKALKSDNLRLAQK